jgi:exonuclease VII small subunit
MTDSIKKIKTTVQTIYENSEQVKKQAKANLAANQKRTQPIIESLGTTYLPVFKAR